MREPALVRLTPMALGLALSGCVAGPHPVSEEQLRSLGRRTYAAQYDEAFDATWLALERLGFRVLSQSRRVGTLLAQHDDGRQYDVGVEPHDAQHLVTALPGPPRVAWQLDGARGEVARWDELERLTRALLAAWKRWPEWTFVPAANDLGVLSLHVKAPREWEHVDLELSRHRAELQRFKPGHLGLNPTLLMDIDRRRPVHGVTPLVLETAGRALGTRTRLSLPEVLAGPLTARGYSGDASLDDGAAKHAVRWHLWDMRTPEWTIRIAAVCGPEDSELSCEGEWDKLVASVVSRGFEFPREAQP